MIIGKERQLQFLNLDNLEVRIVAVLLVTNLLIGISYSLFMGLIKKEWKRGILGFIFMLLCPVIGYIYFFFSWSIYIIFFRNRDISALEDITFNKKRLDMILNPNMDEELNLVPIEEALIVSDKKNMRRVLLDVLKGDYENSLSSITTALESKDSEAAHYAASIITDVVAKFRLNVREFEDKLNNDRSDLEINIIFAVYVREFLEKNVLSPIEATSYKYLYRDLIANLIHYHKEEVKSENYRKVSEFMISIKNNEEAIYWANQCKEQYPDSLESYKALLKAYYAAKNTKAFFEVIEQIKKSDIVLDKETLDIIRFFNIR